MADSLKPTPMGRPPQRPNASSASSEQSAGTARPTSSVSRTSSSTRPSVPRPSADGAATVQRPAQPKVAQTKPTEVKTTATQSTARPQSASLEKKTETPVTSATSAKAPTKMERVIKTADITVDKNINPDNSSYVLYLIMDKPIDGMLNYFRSFGVNVSRIFGSISEARDTLLMQVDPIKIVVVDSGTGRFSSISARKELIDLMGISEEENKTTVFYCDSNLKSDVQYSKEVEDKTIEWIKYKSTASVLAHLLQNKNTANFIQDSQYGKATDIIVSLDYKLAKNPEFEASTAVAPQINTSEIIKNCTSSSGGKMLESFDVKIKN